MTDIEKIMVFVRAILCSAPFVVLCAILLKTNLKKEHRYRQIFMPFIALVYCIVGVVLLNKLSDLILSAIYWLAEKLPFLAFLENLNWAYYGVFIVNSVLVLAFIIVKSLLFPVLTGLGAVPKLSDITSGVFYYVLDSDKKEGNTKTRYLKAKYRDAKGIISAMYWGLLIVSVILLIVTYYMTSKETLSAPFYPAFGVIVLGEIAAFLSGLTYEEKAEEVGEEPEDVTEVTVDYDALVEEYTGLFESRLLQSSAEKPVIKPSEPVQELLERYKKEYEDTLCQNAALLYAYYGNRAAAGAPLDESYIGQARNILDGKSVIFFTQFYNDTTDYVFLPVVRNLMQRKRILVILGNGGSVDNIKKWFYSGICAVNGFEKVWSVEDIGSADGDTSVMVIDTKNIYNQKLLSEKAQLLSEVSMVFIIEPNSLLGTLQIGLSCLITYLRKGGNDPQYIIYERNCDGLVDSLSHVLNKSIEQVNATSIGSANKNMLFWKADGKLLHHRLGMTSSRYLGVGTELALVALKEKAESVSWVSSSKFPVIDMRWISSQYYAALCTAAKIKISQNEFSKRLQFVDDPWSIPKVKESVLVVEDEYNNAFEVARQFSTRGEKESFVNVISPHYWLREYMTSNIAIFKQDPKAIPTVTADYQRNATNIVYKLLMRMIENPIAEEDICDSLDILGEDTDQVYMSLRRLVLKYFFRVNDNDGSEGHYIEKIDNAITATTQVVLDANSMQPVRKRFYAITNKIFVNEFLSQLKIVYYLAEDESDKSNFLGSAMYGHVYQKYLPGMLVSLEGKCYEIVSMTKNNGVLVRRAADHITNRFYYRILRKYKLDHLRSDDVIYGKYSHGAITVERCEANICIHTQGYLKMTEYSNIKNANRVELSNIEPREYVRKECLVLKLADSTPSVRATIAILLNELFVTTFPDNYPYIVAAAKCPDPESFSGMMPELDVEDDESIYIIEDSLIDLGLLNNVDRYLIRFLEIICDALDWHTEKLAEEENAGEDDVEPPEPEPPADDEEDKPQKKRKGIWTTIKGLFGRSKKKKGEEPSEGSDEPEGASNRAFAPKPSRNVSFSKFDILRNGEPDDSGISGDDSESIRISGDSVPDEEDLPYSKSFFLLYGYEEVPSALDLEATIEYLKDQGFYNNYLKQARESKLVKMKWYNYQFENGVHYCDFCGAPLEGKFDLLDDGRERCLECSGEALTKVSEFRKLYKKTRKDMEKIFGIKLKAKISIKTCNAQKIAEELGGTFTPSPGFDGRTLGFACRYGRSHDIYIENGSPAIETAKTLVHEMTHIWQYSNLPDLFENRDLEIIEGMAVWAEVQYLMSIGLKDRAEAYVCNRLMQNNEYGIGLKRYLEKFPVSDRSEAPSKSPFKCTRNPLN